jgi:hypothetical protein
MNEQLAQNTVDMLCRNWQKLKMSLRDCDEIRTDVFLETFHSTEEALRQCLASSAVDKMYIPLIADAYTFAFTEAANKCVKIQAAQILTERMLYQYTVNPEANAENASRITIYILETKRQINIDITDVAAAFPVVEEALEI